MHPSGIEISEDDFQDFKALLKGEAQLAMAMKQFAKRERRGLRRSKRIDAHIYYPLNV